MRAFSNLTGVAAALPMSNVDTDKILPAAYLKTVSREGLGKALFAGLRYHEDGSERSDFVLNHEPWRSAVILVTQDNFGCGSSREHAPWALLDFGIRCIIAPSFADIFRNNCLKNGILPVTLGIQTVQALLVDASHPTRALLTVDLPTQTIVRKDGWVLSFDIDPERKAALMNGLDDIAQSLSHAPQIANFELSAARAAPWTYSEVPDRLVNILRARAMSHSDTC